MSKMIELSEKALRVRGLFPDGCVTDTWYPLQNGFFGMLLSNGSVDLRHKVKLLEGDDSHVWRIDRVTAKGTERFVGYQPMTVIESQLY